VGAAARAGSEAGVADGAAAVEPERGAVGTPLPVGRLPVVPGFASADGVGDPAGDPAGDPDFDAAAGGAAGDAGGLLVADAVPRLAGGVGDGAAGL
jgi:hypothetical protein